MRPAKILGAVILIAVVASAATMVGSVFETVDAGEIVIVQDPIDGELHIWKEPGLHLQAFGRITRYNKSAQYWFLKEPDDGSEKDGSIRLRFNDGGNASVSGSLRFDLPLDDEHLLAIHSRFGSQEAVRQQLVRTVVGKSVYMTGPLMSSKESYAERRADLIQYIADQVAHGVYRTRSEEERVVDALSGKEKTISVVTLVRDADGAVARQEGSPLEELGIVAGNFAINGVFYDDDVDAQIKQQQQALMQVQTAMAEARKSEQKAISAEKEGQAAAASAKWEQEVLKATAVTAGEQGKEVAKLRMEAAEYFKREQALIGEGEAARKKSVMDADGALEMKLAAYVEVQKAYAAEIGKQRWVPEVQMGGATTSGGSNATALMDLLQAKTARDLTVDLRAERR